jgi:hypothetical protein
MSGHKPEMERAVQVLPYHPDSLLKVRSSLEEVTQGIKSREQIIEGIVETVDSLIKYGQYRGFTSTFTLTTEVDPARFRAVLSDEGNGLDLDGNVTDTRLRREKNYSINTGILHQVMDEINYTFKKGSQSELELVNFLN